MTGQTIKCQWADLGATVLHHDPPCISHLTRSRQGGQMGSLSAPVPPMPQVQCCSLFRRYD